MQALSPSSVVAGKYRLVRPLGRGGMGEVWIAENVILQKPVALKVIAEDAAGPMATERFLREAIAASRVHHPAIVAVHDAGVDGDMPWIAMELLDGESLADRIARRPLVAAELETHLFPILDALAALHGAGVVHRDLKPDNIFLETIDGRVRPKLLDFGIAKQQAIGSLTKTGEMIGTGHYLSPEQARGARDLDARSDLYSMGVVLFEALSGRTPYEAETLTELIAKLFTEPPRSLRQLAPRVSEPLALVVHRCLEREPSARPRDARTLLQMLRAATRNPAPQRMAQLPPTLRMPPPLPVRPPPPRRPSAGGIALTVLAGSITIASVLVAVTAVRGAELRTPPASAIASPPASAIVVAAPPLAPTVRHSPNAAHVPIAPPPTDVDPAFSLHVDASPRVRAVGRVLHPHVVVRSGELQVRGARSPEGVRSVVRRATSHIAQCADAARTVYPDVDGRFTIAFTIEDDGTVSESHLASTTLNDGQRTEACAQRVIRGLRFPRGGGQGGVQYPFVLDAR